MHVRFREAVSIERLSDQVADADAVITHDAPLSQALNRRLRDPRIGRFAGTPRAHATGQFNPRDERELFHRLLDRTSLTWREAAGSLAAALSCWDVTGDLDRVFDFPPYDTPAMESVVTTLRTAPSARRSLENATPFAPNDDVVVVGDDFLPTLDRSFVPESARTVSRFTGDTTQLPPFRVFPSRSAIVNAVVDAVEPEHADQYAVVTDTGGPYPALFESAFDAAGIPYRGGPGFADGAGVRTWLALARMGHTGLDVTLREVQGLLAFCGVEVPTADLERRLDAVDGPAFEAVKTVLECIAEYTFDDLAGLLEDWSGDSLRGLRTEFDLLGVADAPLTKGRVADFGFYLDSFDVPVERDDRGVILADAGSETVIDRPVVFHVGLDSEWTRHIPPYPWISPDSQDRNHVDAFTLLLQTGQDRYFLVPAATSNGPTVPCPYFQDVTEGGLEEFSDHEVIHHGGGPGPGGEGFSHVPRDVRPDPPTTLSASRLNSLANSPLDYCFDQLLDSPDRDYFERGTLLHDWAEFYGNHSQFASRLDRDEIVRLMLEEIEPLIAPSERPILETKFRVGTEIVETFLDQQPPQVREYEGYQANFWSNMFAEHFDRPITSPVTERWFQNTEVGVSGVVDLVHRPDRLVDYKSGRSTSVRTVLDRAQVDTDQDRPDYQVLTYLAHHRTVEPDRRLELVFFHLLELVDAAIDGEYDVADGFVTVPFVPTRFEAFIRSREAFDALISDVSETNDRRKTLERFGYEAYRGFFTDHSLPDTRSKDEALASPTATAFEEALVEAVGDYKYVTRGAESAIKQLVELRRTHVLPEDLDAFESYVAEQRDALAEYHRTWFPRGDPNTDRLTHPDLVGTDV